MSVTPHFRSQLHNAVGSGRAVLVTGAGFSAGVKAIDQQPFPTGWQLKEQIWPIAFPDDAFDPDSSLGEIFRVAARTNSNRLRTHLDLCFQADVGNLPSRYAAWFNLPWYRIYTINIDNLAEALQESGPPLRDGIQVLSTRAGSTPGDIRDGVGRPFVHLNGRLADFPDLTFSPQDYGLRTAISDLWYQQFAADILIRPTLFVGTVIDEPPLWHYLQLRGQRGIGQEIRPRSWLVTKSLPAARRSLLAEYNIELIPMAEEEFFETFLFDSVDNLRESARKNGNLLGEGSAPDKGLIQVADAIIKNAKGTADFLLGAEPIWADVLGGGFAVELEFDRKLLDRVERLSDGTLIVSGTAGSGKSTALRRLGVVLAGRGNDVLWIDRSTELGVSQLREEITKRAPDYVLIDDIDRFGTSSLALIKGIARDNEACVVVCAVRSFRMSVLELGGSLPELMPVTNLSRKDARELVSALTRGNRLGSLHAYTDDNARVNVIMDKAKRQLLVALIEATSGRSFQEKIYDEYLQLDDDSRTCYGLLCLAHAVAEPLQLDDLLVASASVRSGTVRAINQLVRSGLIHAEGSRLSVRHRVIAETAVQSFRESGQIWHLFEQLLFLAAIKYPKNNPTRNRYGRLLIRLLGHEFLRKQIGRTEDIRALYQNLEEVLGKEFHYWLQRGSYELESGDLTLADAYLKQSESLVEGEDIKLETAECYLLLKRACSSPQSVASARDANEGIRRLEAILAKEPKASPHTYHVFAVQGLLWIEKAKIRGTERNDLLVRLWRHLEKTAYLFPHNEILEKARSAVLRARALS